MYRVSFFFFFILFLYQCTIASCFSQRKKGKMFLFCACCVKGVIGIKKKILREPKVTFFGHFFHVAMILIFNLNLFFLTEISAFGGKGG